ncbi:hypothetical protein ACU9PU_004860, partial [Escherichia coli]
KEKDMLIKSKGDVRFYLECNDNVFHLVKKKKIYHNAKDVAKGKPKATRKVISDFYFNKNNFHYVDFSANGLRTEDKPIIEMMIAEIE